MTERFGRLDFVCVTGTCLFDVLYNKLIKLNVNRSTRLNRLFISAIFNEFSFSETSAIRLFNWNLHLMTQVRAVNYLGK